MAGRRYAVGGVVVESPFPLPGREAPDASPDVRLRTATIPPPASPRWRAGFDVRGGGAFVTLAHETHGRYRAIAGRIGEVDADPAADTTALLAAGPLLAALLRQRGRLVLHASSVLHAEGALLFCGASGWGKSTLAAAFARAGRAVLGDDLAPLDADLRLHAGAAALRLWPDSLRALGRDPDAHARVHAERTKRFVEPAGPGRTTAPVRAVFVLDPEGDGPPERLAPETAVVEVLRHAFGAQSYRGVDPAGHFARCARLARETPVFRLPRPPVDRAVAEVERCLTR